MKRGVTGLPDNRIRFNGGELFAAQEMYIMSAKGSLQCAIVREAYACSFLAAG